MRKSGRKAHQILLSYPYVKCTLGECFYKVAISACSHQIGIDYNNSAIRFPEL